MRTRGALALGWGLVAFACSHHDAPPPKTTSADSAVAAQAGATLAEQTDEWNRAEIVKRLGEAEPAPVGTRAEERVAAEVPKAVGERLLALVRPQASSQRLVRRAWRSAQRLGTDLDLLWVKPPGAPIEGECERQVTALRRLASVLGATFLIEENDDVVAGAARMVRGAIAPRRGARTVRRPSSPAAAPGAWPARRPAGRGRGRGSARS